MTKQNVIVVHGCPADAEHVMPREKRWMPWVAQELTKKGVDAVAPEMPTPWVPVYSEWKTEIEKYPITEETILVGHSCGAAFLVHYLLDTKKTVKKLILVAPAKIPETPDDQRGALYDFKLPEDGSWIAQERVIFASNDFARHLKSLDEYKASLRAEIITIPDKGHLLIVNTPENTFPELVSEVLSE